ncbi:uncharacterized protein LOC123910059 [Trifolium pratense]|uniref:uncharacterized protein LOC123910059 n=1 Tax=Trifolium pratense TaxID=57577 RepID=UPI001E690265|nr:uncharacterized protein LOC123910059 [Trifolium pratense]
MTRRNCRKDWPSFLVVLGMGERSSLYPDEMEGFYGDAYLYKVEKGDPIDFENLLAFKVISIYLHLINSLLASTPIIYLSFMKMSVKVWKKLVSIQRNFLG